MPRRFEREPELLTSAERPCRNVGRLDVQAPTGPNQFSSPPEGCGWVIEVLDHVLHGDEVKRSRLRREAREVSDVDGDT
jgi:hypothetical protein